MNPSASTQVLMEVAADVARRAGDVALAYFRESVTLKVETKSDGTPVTVADSAAEKKAREVIEARFPEDGILGEEEGETRPGARRRWILDPIDGTKTFIRGVPLWGTLVAVAEGENVLVGAAYFPAVSELLVAGRGAGCFWNNSRCEVSKVSELARATVLSTDERFAQFPQWGARWRALTQQAAVSRTWGDCYSYLLIATGRAEVMVDEVLAPWDSAALEPIIQEAGGVFTDFEGTPGAFGKSGLATNRALSEQVREAFGPEVTMLDLSAVNFEKGQGLVTVIAQDARTGEVLMVAFADRAALERTLAAGEMHYWSRTRGPWHKGATSGNVQKVVSLHHDCDADAIPAQVHPAGPACHTGARTCFTTPDETRPANPPGGAARGDPLDSLARTLASRAEQLRAAGSATLSPSYTQKLLLDRNLRLKKLGEEMAELVTACADGDVPRAVEECADVLYHSLVALQAVGATLDDVRAVLAKRAS